MNTNFTVIGLIRLGIKPVSTAPDSRGERCYSSAIGANLTHRFNLNTIDDSSLVRKTQLLKILAAFIFVIKKSIYSVTLYTDVFDKGPEVTPSKISLHFRGVS